MANTSKPSGLKPVRYLNGANWNGQANLYHIPSTDGTAYYVGDPVTLNGTGDTNGIPGVSIGVAGSAIIGSIVGIVTAPASVTLQGTTLDLTVRSIPATKAKDYYVMVADDPNIIFEIQDGQSTPIAATDIGQNTNFLIAAGGSTVSDSGTTTAATLTGTTTANLKIIGLAQRVDNAFGAYAKVLVLINNHVYKGGTGTAVI